MSSQKKRRKQIKLKDLQSAPSPIGPFRHKDGDRRRRGGPSADEATARKRAMQQFGAEIPGPDPEE